MKIIKKTKELLNGSIEKKIYFCGVLIWFKRRSFFLRKIKIFGITILSYKKKPSKHKNEKILNDINNFITYFQNSICKEDKKIMLWIDHSLGGGTETYSINQFRELENKYYILRLQYYTIFNIFVLSVPNKVISYTSDYKQIKKILFDVEFSEICINNIVGWQNARELLSSIVDYKKKHKETKISFRGHDFYCICPSFNLLNCDFVFCNLSYKDGCDNCMSKYHFFKSKNGNNILFSGFKNIKEWQYIWGEFFESTLDEIVVFSISTKDLLVRKYPCLSGKIKIIPHNTKLLPKVVVKKHLGLNIAMLGYMKSIAKGSNIIEEMCKYNKDPNIRFIVIGSYYKNYCKKIIVSGKYNNPDDIPMYIQKYKIDIVFIPSIWPETFSYITSEVISMGLPIACYNMGAPAERISKYKKGLVLNKIDPVSNLAEIKEFVEKLRKENK